MSKPMHPSLNDLFAGVDLRNPQHSDQEKLKIIQDLMNAGIFPANRPFPGHITPAEEEELAQCIKDRNAETKQLVIKAFVALPAYVRQHIIDSALWTLATEAFRIVAPKTKRHEELEEIKNPSRGFLKTQQVTINERPAIDLGGLNPKYGTVHLNTDILSVNDLMLAHAEQCLVEGITGELQKNQTEST